MRHEYTLECLRSIVVTILRLKGVAYESKPHDMQLQCKLNRCLVLINRKRRHGFLYPWDAYFAKLNKVKNDHYLLLNISGGQCMCDGDFQLHNYIVIPSIKLWFASATLP